MNTTEDFENAPIGATATHKVTGTRAMKMNNDVWCWIVNNGFYKGNEGMGDYTLDQPAPTTAFEALDLAWELAHEVKPGQVIPEGARYLETSSYGLKVYTAMRDFNIRSSHVTVIRTLDPLPVPLPDWLDAPAVVAWSRRDDVRREKVWSKADECYKSTDGEIVDWSDLRDVVPLYPKGQEA